MRTFYRAVITYDTFEYYNELIQSYTEKHPIRKTKEEAVADTNGQENSDVKDEEFDGHTIITVEIEELEVPID